jgi:hypothetical protein
VAFEPGGYLVAIAGGYLVAFEPGGYLVAIVVAIWWLFGGF